LTYDPSCLFCRIAKGELPADVVLDRSDVLAFRDINPQAPTHVLVIPREHLASLEALTEGHAELLSNLIHATNEVARQEGIAGGFRMVTNVGSAAGQSVGHLHLHVLGGRTMHWPPG
jgi:histidine triad (HIT) family protein